MKTKINLTESKQDVFYQTIYPIAPKKFLFGTDYEKYTKKVQKYFILNPEQWEYILEHWNDKEKLLKTFL